MKQRLLFLTIIFSFAPSFVFGVCSSANLTRCLDSVCAINVGANPAARCQYCGTSSAGDPTKSGTMRSISVGASTKYTVSEKELKKAPKDPGERYVWGTRLCIEKLPDCTPDDVSDVYDSLIEQSCKAAGISAEMTSLAKKTNTAKTSTNCSTEIESCVTDAKRCKADFSNCKTESDFDKYFAECGVLSSGCESFLTDIRRTLAASQKTSVANSGKLLNNIVTAYQNDRKQRLTTAQTGCKNNKSTTDCVKRVCENNMRKKCSDKNEQAAAKELCKFYDTACERLK